MGRQTLKLTADTNLLVRGITGDAPEQAAIAAKALREADSIAVTLPTLCELVWVLSRLYKRNGSEIAFAIRRLIGSTTVQIDRPAVEAGLALLDAGGDFADGVIAFEGRRLGGEVFVSFDADAVKRLKAKGVQARLLSV